MVGNLFFHPNAGKPGAFALWKAAFEGSGTEARFIAEI
jgi:hypothetical protein